MSEFTVEAHESLDGLREEWDRVVTGCRAPLFHQPHYLDAYAAAPLHHISRTWYLLARDGDGAPAAVMPVFLQPDMDPLGVVRHQLPGGPAGPREPGPGLLSHVWHCYDTWIPATGPLTAPLFDALLGTVRELAQESGAGWYGLINVDTTGDLAARLDRLAAGHGLRPLLVDERFTADLTAHRGIEEFIASLAPRPRQHLRRFRRRAAESGLTTRVADPGDADLDGLIALVQATMAKFGAASFFPPGRFQRFVTALGSSARIIEQRIDGRLIGGAACLLDADRLHFWISGVDYAAAPTFSPNHLLFLEGVHEALRHGVPVFEGGRRNGEFKERFGLRGRPLRAYLGSAL